MSATGDTAMAAALQLGCLINEHPEPIRVLIADDHALFRRGLEMVLDEEDDIDLVGQASDGAEAVAVAGESLPDVVLMDIRMPKTSGIEACRATKEVAPSAKIVMLTISDEEEDPLPGDQGRRQRLPAQGHPAGPGCRGGPVGARRSVADQSVDGGQAPDRVRHAGQPGHQPRTGPSTSPRPSSPTGRWRCSSSWPAA